MALTRSFRETVGARAQRDAGYRRALLREALEQLVNGDVETGRGIHKLLADLCRSAPREGGLWSHLIGLDFLRHFVVFERLCGGRYYR